MTNKYLEIRDRGTFIPALAIEIAGSDGYLARRAGFDAPMIYLIMLATEHCKYNPYNWDNRTMRIAHNYIEENWKEIKDSDVIDVEFILGESTQKKLSESITH